MAIGVGVAGKHGVGVNLCSRSHISGTEDGRQETGLRLALFLARVPGTIQFVKSPFQFTIISLLLSLSGCGGSANGSLHAGFDSEISSGPRLETKIEGERWYAIPSRCGQGPYEIDLGTLGATYGEGVELLVQTPRRIELTAVLLLNGEEIARNSRVLGQRPAGALAGSKVDNQRCVADMLDVATAVGTSVPIPVTSPSGEPPVSESPTAPGSEPAPRSSTSVTLNVVERGSLGLPGISVIGFSWPKLDIGGHLKIRFWSNLPNDFEEVSFLLLQSAERPNVPELEYEAFLNLQEIERQRVIQLEIDTRLERDRVQRVRIETENLRLEEVRVQTAIRVERQRRERGRRPPPSAQELEQRRLRRVAEQERVRLRREVAERERQQAQIDLRIKLELELRLKLEGEARAEQKRRRRKAYCDSHLKDTKCWGAGGYFVTLDLKRRAGERDAYCALHQNEARCWDSSEWSRRREYYKQRVALANAPEPEPDGPPPVPLQETVPPKLSVNADWRPGYWHWSRGWVWIGGVWRVPASDLEQELTTRAPEMPPAPQVEVRPTPPLRTAVWVSGFWQWDSRAWVWVRGSWQLPPNAEVRWRDTSWSARGSVHVLVPGAWITIGGRR